MHQGSGLPMMTTSRPTSPPSHTSLDPSNLVWILQIVQTQSTRVVNNTNASIYVPSGEPPVRLERRFRANPPPSTPNHKPEALSIFTVGHPLGPRIKFQVSTLQCTVSGFGFRV